MGSVVVAVLRRPRGNRGELAATAMTSFPERYQSLKRVTVGARELVVERVWYHKGQPVFKFQGVDSISDAETLAGLEVLVPAEERFPLPAGAHYFADLTGCRLTDRGKPVGVVTGWRESAAGQVWLEVDDGRVLVPYAASIVPDIDLAAREIRAVLPEGLLELNG